MMISIEKLLEGLIVENQRIEYKAGFDPESILHTICAFANDIDGFQGGYIIIGIDTNNGIPSEDIKGIKKEEIDKIQGKLIEYCKKCISPSYIPNIEVINHKGKDIIVLWVYAGLDKPYYCLEDVYGKESKNQICYIRKGSTTIKANESQIKELVRSSELISYDDRINYKASINDFSISLIKEYLRNTDSDLINVIDEIENDKIYESLHIIDGPKENVKPKNVGLLFFNDDPSNYIPYSYIVVDYIPDPTGDGLITKTFKGPLYRQINDTLQYIQNNFIEKKILKKPNQAESESYFNYPFEVIEEILPNAVLHKDYQIPEPITVKITNEKMEITSFPGFDSTITDQKIVNGDYSSRRYRNKRIAEFLRELHLIEAKNTGIPKAIKAMEKNLSPKLIFEMDDSRQYLTVIIPINNRFSTMYNNLQVSERNDSLNNKVLIALLDSPLNLTNLSIKLGYKSIPNSLRQVLKNLMKENKIIKEGKIYRISENLYLKEGGKEIQENIKNIIYNKLKNSEKINIDEFGGMVLYYKMLRDLEFEGKIKLSEPINVLNAPCAQYKVLEVY